MENKRGVYYNGVFYEWGSIEFKNLFLIEGQKPENTGTLLGLMSESVIQSPDEILTTQ